MIFELKIQIQQLIYSNLDLCLAECNAIASCDHHMLCITLASERPISCSCAACFEAEQSTAYPSVHLKVQGQHSQQQRVKDLSD